MKRPLRIYYTDEARSDISNIGAFIAQDNPIAAAKVLVAVEEAVELLSQFPSKSRKARQRALHALPLSRYPYIIFFKIRPGVLEVLHVFHGARRHPGFQEAAVEFAR